MLLYERCRAIGIGLWILLSVGLLSACTVVDLDENGKPIIPTDPAAAPSYNNMTPDNIANELWQPKLLPLAQQQALSWEELKKAQAALADNGSKPVYVQFTGQVVRLDRESREGRLDINVDGETVALQIGPIVKGNAIRDAAGFIRFDDFKNQVQFAQLARSMNKKALQNLPAIDESWQGENIRVLAALTLTKQGTVDAVPLELHKGAQ
ncbi:MULTISPECIES: DUF2291 family protein [unclassified Brenneria]|uniref:DUF2291 family protein n=1 Tax=unclassified Brenneria TaxID=2634434 RepID=UPI0029C3D530|nr:MULTISPECIES: DUF2291 family protein [unclassified Brenneria]MDX5627091.1 DUF2291 family protein [Brenneria sp. L3-3Z]MDX5693559.1 DUF2291 family protein [Brenneria sp. L4-2C]